MQFDRYTQTENKRSTPDRPTRGPMKKTPTVKITSSETGINGNSGNEANIR